MKKTVVYTSILGLALAASAGFAQWTPTIEIYEHQNFRGQQRILRDGVPNLRTLGFDDMISSVRIIEGSWEMCREPNYVRCEPILNGRRGDIVDMNPYGWNDNISSIRPIRGHGDRPGRPPGAGGRPPSSGGGDYSSDRYSIDGRGVLALEGEKDVWFNKCTLTLNRRGTFELQMRTSRSQSFSGTYRWTGRNEIELQVEEGPGRGTGTAWVEDGKLHSVEITGSFRRSGIYTASFINYQFAPWN